uniref:Protopolybia-mastoparan-I n=1 Tax=Protopolybia exigua TaxID=91439 RepID=MAST1_PROEX|nr:RecName: Full=Protopolybia-mastoparan-I; Short=Protopolybia-MP-I; Short=Protopolybia-MPI [Protopolybia exigua]
INWLKLGKKVSAIL